MSLPPYFPGQPGFEDDDPQIDLTLLALHDAFGALSSAALFADTDEEDRVPGLLADVDVIAFGFAEHSAEARLLSQAASVIRERVVIA